MPITYFPSHRPVLGVEEGAIGEGPQADGEVNRCATITDPRDNDHSSSSPFSLTPALCRSTLFEREDEESDEGRALTM